MGCSTKGEDRGAGRVWIEEDEGEQGEDKYVGKKNEEKEKGEGKGDLKTRSLILTTLNIVGLLR